MQTPIKLQTQPDGKVRAVRTDTDADICTPFSNESIARSNLLGYWNMRKVASLLPRSAHDIDGIYSGGRQ